MNSSRLAVLIDSLASGADVFSSSKAGSNEVNEMEIVLQGHAENDSAAMDET